MEDKGRATGKPGYVVLYVNGQKIATKRYGSKSKRSKIIGGWCELHQFGIIEIGIFPDIQQVTESIAA